MSQFTLARLQDMASGSDGDDNQFFAAPQRPATPPPLREDSGTVVQTIPPHRMPWVWGAAAAAGAVLLAVLLWFALRGSQQSKMQEQLTEAQARVNALQGQIADLHGAMTALEKTRSPANAAAAPPNHATAEDDDAMADLAETLGKKLASHIERGDAQVNHDANGLLIVLTDKIVFETDEDDISDTGETVLHHVGTALTRAKGHDIEVRSYTDSKPIPHRNEEKFSSNWELSALRATQVVRFLQDETNIEPSHLVAMGFGQYRTAENAPSEQKKRSRRIEIAVGNSASTDACP